MRTFDASKLRETKAGLTWWCLEHWRLHGEPPTWKAKGKEAKGPWTLPF